ncbi:MAG: DUF4358 domain-containing protein [Clostridia bacterium]|nr:DUF4358 domain-containing protein [Clostridia bacterium]
MLRKILPIAIALGLLLTACGAKPAAEYDPAKTAQALVDSGAFSEELEPLDLDFLPTVYGVGGDVTSGAIYSSTGATAEEVVVLLMTAKADADHAFEQLEKRVEGQKAACEGYLPLELPKLDNAIVKQVGSSVLLVVANDYDAAQKALDGLS